MTLFRNALAVCVTASLLTVSFADAAAPQPTGAVPATLYAGRWYEIARTPNFNERHCAGATSDFSGYAKGAFNVVETCHVGGRAKVTRAKATIVPGSRNAKFRMGFLGGLIHQEYWILDTAPAGDWAIMATPGGHYVWLLARSTRLDAQKQATALARAHSLGFSTAALEYD